MVIWNLENTTSGVAQYVLPKPPSTAELGAADAIVDGTYSLATSIREAGLAIGFGKAFLVSLLFHFLTQTLQGSRRLDSPLAQALWLASLYWY